MSRIKRSKQHWRWKLALGSCLVISGAIGEAVLQTFAFSVNCTFAQIIPDTTLPNNSRVTTQDNIRIIEGGTQVGRNLFHSFQEFSVPTNSGAYFNNAVDIQNIISRVTGGSVSNIDGLIGTNGTANLFLINPNGIIFGANAQLNVGGSFVASTANALQFGNIGFFSATDQNIPSPLLTINPSALLFNQINQNAAIQNNSIAFAGRDPADFNAFGLRVPDGKSLLLVGDNVSIDAGELNAYGGRVELRGLAQAGTIALSVDGDNLSLRFPSNVVRTSVSLTNQAAIYVEGTGGGNIAVNASNLEILGGSILSGGIGQGLGTSETIGGDITLNATEEIKVAGGSIVHNLVRLGSLGNGGNITIDSGSFSLQDGALLTASTYGQGNAGTIKVNATDFFTLSGKSSNLNSGMFVNSQSTTGTAGDILVTSPRVTLDNSGTLNAQSTSGNGGDINLQTDLLLLRRGASISTTAGTAQAGGNGGNITINAPLGFIVAVPRENSDITANAYTGSGGRVDIQAFGIYGIQPRSNQTSLSDITASSEFGVNTVELNTPDIDPNGGNINLPAVPVDSRVAQGCTAGSSQAQSKFIITGRGGIPSNPGEALSADAVQVGLVTLNPEVGISTPAVSTNPINPTPHRIVEASGWVIAANDDVILTSAPTVTPHSSWQRTADCRVFNQRRRG